MKPGRLHHTLTAQRQTTAQDAMGQPAQIWTDIATRRASIEPLNGREYLRASGEGSDVSTRIRLRYDATIGVLKAYDRLIDQSVSPMQVYDIESVIVPRERNREMVCMCRKL